MIPTMTLRMPSRINEVDVCLNMKGISFRLAQPHRGILRTRGACRYQQTPALPLLANTRRLWRYRHWLGGHSAGGRSGVGLSGGLRAQPELKISECAGKQGQPIVHEPVAEHGQDRR